jgi:predicted metal-dependent hydrolase
LRTPAPTPPPQNCREGIDLFHDGQYFLAHEVLEVVWREAAPEDRKFFQGLIQIAVALHHHSRGNVAGCRSLLARASRNLSLFPDKHYGIELGDLIESLRSWQHALDDGRPAPPPPRIRFKPAPTARP